MGHILLSLFARMSTYGTMSLCGNGLGSRPGVVRQFTNLVHAAKVRIAFPAQLDGCERENMLYTEQKQVFVLLMFHFKA
tara:strand:- start:217 stop:453 length:237 start_codon:yes stop_codon:yes gene_type:complete